MNPIAFGSRARQLFGVFHPAMGDRLRSAAVLCPPFGIEYLRGHRALRLLADRLASAGTDVLRFDYFGTGDSGGEGLEVDLAGCVADAESAIEEVRAVAEVERIVMVGVRFGSLVAACAAAGAPEADRMVLWDPLDPEALVAEWSRDTDSGTPDPLWVEGFPVSARLRTELGELDSSAWGSTDRVETLVVASDASVPEALRRRARDPGWAGSWERGPERGPWDAGLPLGHGSVPIEVLRRIERWCT